MNISEKRVFWIKLPKDFFRDKAIKKLRRVAGGDTYTIIYLKMLLASAETEGILYFDGIEEDICEEIALELDEDPDNVRITVNFLIAAGLAELSDADISLTRLPEMVGSESDSARRMRECRKRKLLQSNANSSQCDSAVTTSDEHVTTCYTENRREETEKKREETEEDIEQIKNIIDHLNQMAGTGYRHKTDKTKRVIRARFNDGFTEEDFYTVIDKKCTEWIGTEMEKYLRPETLFGTKFEGYLNERVHQKEGRLDWLGRMYNESMDQTGDWLEGDVFQ